MLFRQTKVWVSYLGWFRKACALSPATVGDLFLERSQDGFEEFDALPVADGEAAEFFDWLRGAIRRGGLLGVVLGHLTLVLPGLHRRGWFPRQRMDCALSDNASGFARFIGQAIFERVYSGGGP